MSDDSHNLWTHTIGYGRTAPAIGFLTAEQNCRLERMRAANMLWKGHHKNFFLTEGRTQFDFPEMAVQGKVIRPYITLNVLKLITTTLTDLLLGEEPLLTIDDEAGQDLLDQLKNRSDLHRVFYDAARTASRASEAMVEIIRWEDEVWIQDVKPQEIFPIGERQPDGQFQSYRRYATAEISQNRRLLLETTYLPGEIKRECFLLDGSKRGDKVDLALWPTMREGMPLPDVEPTGIEWNTIVWMGNEIDEGCPTSDYDGLIELQDELNAKQSQIARVIAKHADPKLGLPAEMFDGDSNVKASATAFAFRSKEELPQYIVWNAELAAAIEDRDFTLRGLCIASELSPGLLGLEQGAAPDSARKLRLQATKALSRTKRKSSSVRPFIRTAMDTAMMMINAGRKISVAMGGSQGCAVDLRDGLPIDELDQAQTISMLTGGKPTMSVERGVGLLLPDPEAAEKELERLNANIAAATPSIFIDGAEPAMDAPADATDAPDAPVTAAPAVAPATGQELQTSTETVLNGAQVTAATAIVIAVAKGEMPRDSGLGQLKILFNLDDAQASEIMGSAGTDAPTTPNPKPNEPAPAPAAEVVA